MLLPVLIAAVALQVWAWQRLDQRLTSGAISKAGAVLRYGGWALAPLLLFIGLLAGASGTEELTGAAIIPELVARSALPAAALLLGMALLGWVCYLIRSITR